LNRERRTIEGEMNASAWDKLDPSVRAGICVYDPSWHQGVTGILASRIKDRLHRPVIAFAPSGDDGLLKGSARSIAGVHIRDVLCTIAARHPGLLHRFGGHAMAAGLTLAEEHLGRFAEVFDETVAASLTGVDLEPTVVTDGELPQDAFHIGTALLLREAGPWGKSFPEPLFDGEFEVRDGKVVAERHVRLNLAVPGSGQPVEGIAFGVAEPEEWLRRKSVRMAFRLEVNEFRGTRRLQLGIEYMEAMD
jgi:single-stranded-DNA-specific exonuclease